MGPVRFLHIGPKAGPHGEFEDFWLKTSSRVARSEYLHVPPVNGRDLLNHVTYYLKKYRPRVLVTHADTLIRPAAWAASTRGVKLVCHRYAADVLPRGAAKRITYARASAYVVPTYASGQAVQAMGVDESKIHVVPIPPLRLHPVVDGPEHVIGVWRGGKHFSAIAQHFERHRPDVRFLLGAEEPRKYEKMLKNVSRAAGDLRSFLCGCSVVLDFNEAGVHRHLAEARYWGRPVLVPEGKINQTTYGEGAVYYNRGTLPALLLKALSGSTEVVPLTEDPIRALTSLYTRMVA